jgi:hypothetical protein
MTEQSDRPERPERPSEPRDTGPEPGPIRQLARLFLTQLLAVVAIAAVITAVVSWTGAGLDEDVTTAAPAAPRSSASPAPQSSTATSTPPSTSSSAAPEPTTSSAAPSTTAAQELPRVDVLNQSAAGGSAHQTADRLRTLGWRIGRVDDFFGNISETTVYFPPGMRAEARQLRRDLPGSPRLQPAFSTLSPRRLSVILVG